MPPRGRILMLLGLAAALAPLPPAQAQNRGQFSITPARRTVVGRPPVTIGTTTVGNSTKKTFKVRAFPVYLDQRLDGSFAFGESTLDIRKAGLAFSVSPASFVLTPGQTQPVKLRWEALPRNARFAAIGVIYEGTPTTGGQQIGEVDRLVGVNFLRLPGNYTSSGRFTGLRGEQAGPRKLQFQSKVENTGEVMETPRRTRLTIKDAGGRTVFRSRWVGDIVLPGAEREFPTPITSVLQKGTYTAVSEMDFGSSRGQRIAKRFTLVGPNTLPSPKLEVTDFAAGETIGDPVHVTATFRSTGTAPASSEVSVTLVRIRNGVPDDKPLGAKRIPFENVPPGTSRPLAVSFPTVPPGNYRAIARYRDEAGELQTLTSDFQPTEKHRSGESWFSKHAVAFIAGLLGVLALLLLFFLLWRRRRREEEDEPGPVPVGVAPAPTAPPAGLVDLNTATAEELATLPGVGPRAAARIIDHREEYGRFRSVDDLAAVEGFDPERVAQLDGQVGV